MAPSCCLRNKLLNKHKSSKSLYNKRQIRNLKYLFLMNRTNLEVAPALFWITRTNLEVAPESNMANLVKSPKDPMMETGTNAIYVRSRSRWPRSSTSIREKSMRRSGRSRRKQRSQSFKSSLSNVICVMRVFIRNHSSMITSTCITIRVRKTMPRRRSRLINALIVTGDIQPVRLFESISQDASS